MLQIFSKELKSYFHSSTAYIFLFIFLLLSGIFFSLSNLAQGNGAFNYTIYNLIYLSLFLSPILTMKILASETNDKTDQLLLTAPLRIWEIVIGKFLAATALFLIGVAVTLIYPLILKSYGPIPTAQIFCSYVGFILIGTCFISIGIFISSLTSNQVTAAIGTFGVLFVVWIADWITSGLPTSAKSGLIFSAILLLALLFFIYYNTKNVVISMGSGILGVIMIAVIYFTKKTLYEGFIVKFLGWLSLFNRYESFNLGVLSLTPIVYYITFSMIFVYLTIAVIDRRRWN